MMQFRHLKVEPIAGEVIDGAGICDIQVINVFMLNTYSRFEYLILIPVLLENRTFCMRVAWRSLWCVMMASKMLMARDAPPPHLSSGLVIGINFVIIMVEDLISVSCSSRDKLFICNKQVGCFIMNKAFMVTLWLWMSYSCFILDDCVLNIYKALNTKRCPNLIMTSFPNDTTFWAMCMK